MTAVILVAEDHPLFRQAVVEGLASCLPHHRFEQAASLDEVRSRISARRPALLLLDLDIPGASGLGGLAAILAEWPGLPVAILSASSAPDLVAGALAIGVRGYFSKSLALDMLAGGVTAVLNGEIRFPDDAAHSEAADDFVLRYATLSPQQCRVLGLIVDGLLNKQIAGVLGISEQRVKEHVSQIMHRLGVSTRTQAAVLARTLLSGGKS